jgi:hypothetical protein
MSYIICAEVDLDAEENHAGDIEKVEARTLSSRDGHITFDIRGNFKNKKELTKHLCTTLIDAGFVSFDISHSY